MSTKGDAYRAQALALQAAYPALRDMEGWYDYWKAGALSAAYEAVATNNPKAVDLYNYLAAQADAADQPPPEPEPVPPDPTPPSGLKYAHGKDLTADKVGIKGVGVAESSLKGVSGTYKTTKAGEVIEGVHIKGGVLLGHSDVTIRKSIIEGSGQYLISPVGSSSTTVKNLTVEDSVLLGVSGTATGGILSAIVPPYFPFTMRRVDGSHCMDLVKTGSNCRMENVYLHAPWHAAGAHSDVTQSVGGRDVIWLACKLDCQIPGGDTGNSAIFWTGENGHGIVNHIADKCWFAGGNYCVVVDHKDGVAAPVGCRVTNGVFKKGSWRYGPIRTTGDVVKTGNTYEDGSPV